jgi:broad specificity phosphatase PhoE
VRLLLIRHGHTANNGGHHARLTGRTDVPLSPRGLREVQRLRQRLKQETPFAAIYSSPLQRAWTTAAALRDEGLGPVYACPDLQEIDCGNLEGVPLEEVQRRFPVFWEANLRQQDEHFRWPGGESYREFRCRCLRAVRSLARRHADARVALVTHAGVVSQILGTISRTSPARWERFRPGNTALSELEWHRGAVTLVRFDDRAHLE